MNSNLLLQLIAARTGNGNGGVAEILARVRGIDGGTPAHDPRQLLALLGNNNPLVSALSKQFTETQANGSVHQLAAQFTPPEPEAVIDVEPAPEGHKQISSSGSGVHGEGCENADELKNQIQNLQAEVKTLRDRCDRLASTVGACCLCWGQDPECRACRGRGKPGYAIPDESLFGEFVLPAMRVLRAQKAKPNRPVATQRPQNGGESSPQIS
jgi:hypothetical protein